MISPRFIRTTALALMGATTLWLAGCSSAVKLDDNVNGLAPITNASSGRNTGTNDGSMSSNNVAPVTAQSDNGGGNNGGGADASRIIYFDYDSFIVKEQFRPAIETQAKRLNATRGSKIIIEGHTDQRGGSEYNLALGQKRAEAVQKSLVLLGVSGDQIESVSFGKERPAAMGTTEEDYAKNRRAEIKDR